MARTRTRTQIRSEARLIADEPSDGFTDDTACNEMIDESAALLQGMLGQIDPERYLVRADITTVAATLEYALPAAFKSIVRLDWRPTTSERYRVEPFQIHDMAEGNLSQGHTGLGTPQCRYRVLYSGMDGATARLVFDRQPPVGTFELWYVQAPANFANDNATIDGVAGWENWIVWDVAVRLMIRAETDPSAAMAERARIEQLIRADAPHRDAGRPKKVQDTRGRNFAVRRFW